MRSPSSSSTSISLIGVRVRTPIAAILVLLAVLAGIDRSRPAPAAVAAVPARVALVVLENREFGEVVGNPEAPFLNRLARRGALATHYYAVAHPSLPNYLALLGGSTFGIDENCTTCSVAGDNLAAQLSRANISWRAYMEGLPSPCYRGATHGRYVKRHNPFMYFRSIAARGDRCRNVVPATALSEDLRRDSLPAFSWVTPDLCHDGTTAIYGPPTAGSHGSSQDHRELGPRLLVVTFDEGTSDRGCCAAAVWPRSSPARLRVAAPA